MIFLLWQLSPKFRENRVKIVRNIPVNFHNTTFLIIQVFKIIQLINIFSIHEFFIQRYIAYYSLQLYINIDTN